MKCLLRILLAWFALCGIPPAFAAPPNSVQAVYDIYKDGLKVGRIEESFTRNGDRYTLTSTTTPVGILAMFKPEKVFIRSSGRIGVQGLQPEHFSHRRERDERKDSAAEFDWEKRQLTLVHQAQRTAVALPDGTQDRLSAMYQFMFLPLPDRTTLDFAMTNGSKLDSYRYVIADGQRIETPAGRFDTLYLDNQAGAGESRTEIWLARQQGNLPCKMVITDADGDRLTQVLSKLSVTP